MWVTRFARDWTVSYYPTQNALGWIPCIHAEKTPTESANTGNALSFGWLRPIVYNSDRNVQLQDTRRPVYPQSLSGIIMDRGSKFRYYGHLLKIPVTRTFSVREISKSQLWQSPRQWFPEHPLSYPGSTATAWYAHLHSLVSAWVYCHSRSDRHRKSEA